MKEQWKTIPGYEGEYEASNLGNIRSIDRSVYNRGSKCHTRIKGRQLTPVTDHQGYQVVNLRRHTRYVHRLVVQTHIGFIPQGMTVNHKDGDKSNNSVQNLEIATYSENHLHAFRELHRRPSCLGVLNHPGSKAVMQLTKNGQRVATFPSAREAERQTGICHKGISATCHGKAKSAGGYLWQFDTHGNDLYGSATRGLY